MPKKKQYQHEDRLAGTVSYTRRHPDGREEVVTEVLCKFRFSRLQHEPGVFGARVVDPKAGEICDHCGLSRLD